MMNQKIESALRLLGIFGVDVNEDVIKKAYRKASSIYHPDKGGSTEMMQAVNNAYDTLKDFQAKAEEIEVSFDAEDSYPEDFNNALNIVLSLEGLIVEVCGIWIWVTGNTMEHKETLKAANFKWAKKKVAWHFRPSDYKSKGRGTWDLDRIRDEHGSKVHSQKQTNKLKN